LPHYIILLQLVQEPAAPVHDPRTTQYSRTLFSTVLSIPHTKKRPVKPDGECPPGIWFHLPD
jgi:hypothetical protein